MFSNVSATVAAHITTWQATRLPFEPTPNAPDIFDGKPSPEVDDATSDVVANVLLVIGAAAFVVICVAFLLTAGTKGSYGKRIFFGVLALVFCLGPGAIVKWVDGGFSGIFT